MVLEDAKTWVLETSVMRPGASSAPGMFLRGEQAPDAALHRGYRRGRYLQHLSASPEAIEAFA